MVTLIRILNCLLLLLLFTFLKAQDRAIEFPDIPGYRTLKCDFHIHSVFSDGSVWPDIRVQEAVKDGLDAISLTEHLEYQPHLADLPHPDRNRSYEIAKELAKPYDLLVIHGAEITRKLPPGHANAIFITDANKLNIKDSIEAYREANRQGAFVFWNHPNWIAQQHSGVATLTELHKMLIDKGHLHGIEVVNDLTYSDEALQISLDHNLTIMGCSDIHGLVDWQFRLDQGGHRPITLVFATEKSEAAIKEALFAHRTVAWFDNLLVGQMLVLEPLIRKSIKIGKATYQGPSSVVSVEIENVSDATFILKNESTYTFHSDSDVITIEPKGKKVIEVKTGEQKSQIELQFSILNALMAPNQHPSVSWIVDVDL
ncbi:MAG: PHP domain-containing protein [Saprospiraceae bacterium]|nr:PHP domain-containing protein [Saprospiraceae bacterium]